MKTTIISWSQWLFVCVLSFAWLAPAIGAESDSALSQEEAKAMILDSLERFDQAIPYREGKVPIKDFLTLNIPQGYRFIPEKEAKTIIKDFWQNPEDNTILGMIVPKTFKLTNWESWAFIVSYDEVGYIKDEDAADIDYKEMLKDIQSSEQEVNRERTEQGYPNMYLLDWAAQPYYDQEKKILHWAKKLKFGDEAVSEGELTLNYEVRVLGRKGMLSMNAVGTMAQLSEINQHIPDVLGVASFNDGFAYSDFNPSVDKVAAYTVGGLIAGKLLAKTGLFVLLLKNIKLVLFGLLGLIAAFRRKIANLFRGRNKAGEEETAGEGNAAVPAAEIIPAVPEQDHNFDTGGMPDAVADNREKDS